MYFKILLISAGLLVNGCATSKKSSAVQMDLSRTRRISVVPFAGPGGEAATNEFVRALIGRGIEVTDAKHGGDVILEGTVTEYKPTNQLMVFLGRTTLVSQAGQTLTVDNALISPEGSTLTPERKSAEAQNAQVASVIATVVVSVKLVDPATHAGVWLAHASYEALDPQAAMQATVALLTGALAQKIPQMNKRST